MDRTKTSSADIAQLIKDGCARKVPAELHHEDVRGTTSVGRVRLLELTDGEILADRPLYTGKGDEIPRGLAITVHLSVNGSRYEFKSAIEGGIRMVRLNARQVVPGIALRIPSSVSESQRRSARRITLVSYDPINVDMVRPHPDVPNACSIDAELIPEGLVDISVGGVSVLVDRNIPSSVRRDERFFLTFTLPTDAEEFYMFGPARHSRVVKPSDSLRVGLTFRPWRGPRFTYEQRRLSRSIAKIERRLLRPRK